MSKSKFMIRRVFLVSLFLLCLPLSSYAVSACKSGQENPCYLKIWAPLGWKFDKNINVPDPQVYTTKQCSNSDQTEMVIRNTGTTNIFQKPMYRLKIEANVTLTNSSTGDKVTMYFNQSAPDSNNNHNSPELFRAEMVSSSNPSLYLTTFIQQLASPESLTGAGNYPHPQALTYCATAAGCAGVVQLFINYAVPPDSQSKAMKSSGGTRDDSDCMPDVLPKGDPLAGFSN